MYGDGESSLRTRNVFQFKMAKETRRESSSVCGLLFQYFVWSEISFVKRLEVFSSINFNDLGKRGFWIDLSYPRSHGGSILLSDLRMHFPCLSHQFSPRLFLEWLRFIFYLPAVYFDLMSWKLLKNVLHLITTFFGPIITIRRRSLEKIRQITSKNRH